MIDDVLDPQRPSTVEDLLEKGYPLMMPSRRMMVQQTAERTIEEVVADLGNFMTMGYGSVMHTQRLYPTMRMGSWAPRVTLHAKTLRLIEQGREQPQRVAPLLRRAIEEHLELYDVAGPKAMTFMDAVFKGKVNQIPTSDIDP